MKLIGCLLLPCYFLPSMAQEQSDSLSLSQDTINAEMVSQYTSYFKIEEGLMEGIGAEILRDEFAKSQFVLLGETHEDAQIALFTEAILLELAAEGYKHFVLEQGRSSLNLLLNVLEQPIDLEKDLRILHQESVDKTSEPYFPFMSGIEDAAFMQKAIDGSFTLHGIDQEFFYSFPFLFDQLKLSAKKNVSLSEEEKEKIEQAHLVATEYLLEQYKLEKRQEEHPIFTNLLKSAQIQNFFDLVNNNQQNLEITQDILLSWRIYEQNRINRSQSYRMRGDLIKERFKMAYNNSAKKEAKPKMLVKLGALHVMKGTTPLGITDIGEQANQMAKKNSSQDLNLYFMFRYYLDKKEEFGYFDNAEGNSNWLKERHPIILQGKVEEWAIIDLRSLKIGLEEGEFVYVYPPIQKLMERHDYILIPPATKDIQPNFEPVLD